jgi:histidinol-phosphatase
VASNGHLHEAALAFLGSVKDADDPDTPERGGGSVHDFRSRRRPAEPADEPPLG